MTGKLTLSFDITVVWKRSSVWGYCPTVEAAATLYEGNAQRRHDTGMGHASGCGYDKRSAAVNTALYDLPLLQTLLFERRETEWLRDFFDGEVTDGMLHGVDRDAVFWAWRDMSDATSGDCDFDAAMLPEYLKSAEGTAHHA